MGWGRRLQFPLLVLAMAPAGHAAAESVSLASASRTCTGETRVRVVSSLLQPGSVGQEQASAMGETVSVRRVGDQFEIRRSFSVPGGEAVLIAHIRPNGTVIDANVTGGLPGVASDQLRQMSSLAARTLPERLILGRAFHPGDNLYADLDPQELVANMVGAMAVPPGFQFQLSGGIPFAGMIGDGASRALNFAGDLRTTGSGQANGHTMAMTFPARVTMTIDAASGLMRSLLTEGTMELKLDGVTQMQMHLRQDLTCTIVPAA